MSKRAKAARHAAKANAKEHRIEKRTEKKNARVDKRATASERRTATRGARQGKRVAIRQGKINSRKQKKLEKTYGELDEANVDAINSVAPLTPAMADELQEQGVGIDDVNDPIEVASKYVQLSDEMDDPIDQDVYDDAFVNGENDFDSHFDWTKAKDTAKRALKGALGGVANEALKYTNELDDKAKRGLPLTPAEQKLLDAAKKGKGAIKDKILDDLKGWLPLIFALIALGTILYFKAKR